MLWLNRSKIYSKKYKKKKCRQSYVKRDEIVEIEMATYMAKY